MCKSNYYVLESAPAYLPAPSLFTREILVFAARVTTHNGIYWLCGLGLRVVVVGRGRGVNDAMAIMQCN